MHDVKVGSYLLCPVSGNSSANGEDAECFLLFDSVRKVVEINEWVEDYFFFSLCFLFSSVDAYIESEFAVGECRNVNRDVVFVCRLKNSSARCVLAEVCSDVVEKFPTA